MINTDKYEGHTPAPWKWFAERPLEVSLIGDLNSCADTKGGSRYILDRSAWGEDPNQDAQLIADAPLLLAEVKRLRDALRIARDSLVWSDEDFIVDEAFAEQIESVRDNIARVLED
tara:strand:+ start:449 stop:796 length:348 start_codon:yes stop_codon:yes gene_type:complete